jgi:hypothetical protein
MLGAAKMQPRKLTVKRKNARGSAAMKCVSKSMRVKNSGKEIAVKCHDLKAREWKIQVIGNVKSL